MKKIYLSIIATACTALIVYAANTKNASQLYEEAKCEFDANNFETSLVLYLKADSAFVAEGSGNTAEYAQSLHSTGRVYINVDKIQEGRDYTHRAMALRERLFGKVSEEYIVSLNNYALTFLIDNELDEALKNQTEVISLCSKMDTQNPDEGKYLINLARIYHVMQDDVSAVKYMEMALPMVRMYDDQYEYVLNFLGNVYMEENDNANVNRILGLTDEYYRGKMSEECSTPECHLERAEYYISAGNPASAKDEFMAVFAMPLSNDQKSRVYQHYGKFLYSQRDYAQAGEYFSMAANASILAKGENENAIALLRQGGLCYYLGKEYGKAIEAYLKVVSDVDKYKYSEALKSSSLQGLGNSFSAVKEYSKSISTFKQWIEHLKLYGHENEKDYAKAYEKLATAEKFNSEYDESIADYKTAIELYEKLGLNDEAQQAMSGLKMCLFYANKDLGEFSEDFTADQQRKNKLNEIILSCVNILAQGGDYLGKLFKAQTLATIAGSYAQLGDYKEAIDYYNQYVNEIRPALIEDFLLKTPKERELTWKKELSNIKSMNAMIVELPEDMPELYSKLSNLIFEGQLLSKSILLSSNIEFEKVINRLGTSEMKNQYRQIKENLVDIEKMKQERLPVEEIQDLIRRTDALQLALARESASLGIYTDFLKYTSADVLKALNDDEAAIEFVTLETGIWENENIISAIVVCGEIPQGITIPICTGEDLKMIMDDKGKFANEDYTSIIWGNIMQLLNGKKRIYFSPDGLLNNIGIEYLTLGGQPIDELIEMVRLSSTRELCREHHKHPIQYAVLFGNIDYMGDPVKAGDKQKYKKTRESDGLSFSVLENTDQEVKEIENTLKKNIKKIKVFPYTAQRASKAEFLSQDELPINLLHIATHGKYIDREDLDDKDAMKNSILAFAGANLYNNINENEGIVTAAEIAEMTLHDCNLVVLSACESGLGKLSNDGVLGLQRGFKNAGVQSLLVSLNEVADEATADMMIAFYRNLVFPNISKQEALKKAQSEIRSKYPNDNTWASFILIDSFN